MPEFRNLHLFLTCFPVGITTAVDAVVPANVKAIVLMDIAGMIIDGTYGRIAPRSVLAA